jgi:dephospho-CoA kinase
MPGSGKSVVTMHLQAQGLKRIYFGDLVLKEVEARGLHLIPDNERLVREDLRRVHGMAAMAVLSLPVIEKALQEGPVVIDGLYSFTEYKFLREKLGDSLVVLAIASTRALRYERLSCRPVRPLTPMEAEKRDLAEIEHIEKGGPIAIADYTVLNDGVPETLLMAIDTLLPLMMDEGIIRKVS